MADSSSPPLMVLLIDSDPKRAKIVEDGLKGAAVVRQASQETGGTLLRLINDIRPDVIIIDCESPDRDTIENLRAVAVHNPKPVVMFVEDGDGGLAKEAIRAGVSAYIVDGLSASRVKPVIDVAVERFGMVRSLQDELEKSKADLAARKTIERAKGLLMKQRGLSEPDAYKAMRDMAMKQGKPLKDVADSILAVASLLSGDE